MTTHIRWWSLNGHLMELFVYGLVFVCFISHRLPEKNKFLHVVKPTGNKVL